MLQCSFLHICVVSVTGYLSRILIICDPLIPTPRPTACKHTCWTKCTSQMGHNTFSLSVDGPPHICSCNKVAPLSRAFVYMLMVTQLLKKFTAFMEHKNWLTYLLCPYVSSQALPLYCSLLLLTNYYALYVSFQALSLECSLFQVTIYYSLHNSLPSASEFSILHLRRKQPVSVPFIPTIPEASGSQTGSSSPGQSVSQLRFKHGTSWIQITSVTP